MIALSSGRSGRAPFLTSERVGLAVEFRGNAEGFDRQRSLSYRVYQMLEFLEKGPRIATQYVYGERRSLIVYVQE